MLAEGRRVATSTVALGKYDVSWYTAGNAIWPIVAEAANVPLDRFPTADSYRMASELDALNAGVDADVFLSKTPAWKLYSDTLSQWRRSILVAHPEIGAALRVWYGVDLPDKDLPPATKQALADETSRLYEALGVEE